MERNFYVMGILIGHRRDVAPRTQEVLSQYGDIILGRMGVSGTPEQNGLVTLTIKAEEEDIDKMVHDLRRVDGVNVNYAVVKKNRG